jgi:hypothetical protein
MGTDSILGAAKAVGAFILLIIALLVAWAFVSPIAFVLRVVLQRLGAKNALDALVGWLKKLRPTQAWQIGWLLIPVREEQTGLELRLVIDRRLGSLERCIDAFVAKTREATNALLGLGSSKGPTGLAQQIAQLREGLENLGRDETPYDIGEADLAATKEEMSAGRSRWFMLCILVVIMLANGGLLSEVFREMGFSSTLFGFLKINTILAVLYVVIETGVGALLQISQSKRNFVLLIFTLFIAAAAIAFEVIIFDRIGASQLAGDGLDESWGVLRHYLGLFGFVLASVNCIAGYYYHHFADVVSGGRARQRIVKDAISWNNLLVDLPERLDEVRGSISATQAVLDDHFVSVGNRADSFSGAVDQVSLERQTVIAALRDANVSGWPQWLPGAAGDHAQSRWISVAMALLTAALGVLFAWSFSSQVHDVFPRGEMGLVVAGSIGAAVALYIFGFFILSKIELLEAPSNRTFPIRPADLERVLGAIILLAATAAIWGFSIYAHGLKGIAPGALNSMLAALLVIMGSQWERSLSGSLIAIVVPFRGVLAASFLIGWVVLQLLGWIMTTLGMAVFYVLHVLAFPTDFVVAHRERRSLSHAPNAAEA